MGKSLGGFESLVHLNKWSSITNDLWLQTRTTKMWWLLWPPALSGWKLSSSGCVIWHFLQLKSSFLTSTVLRRARATHCIAKHPRLCQTLAAVKHLPVANTPPIILVWGGGQAFSWLLKESVSFFPVCSKLRRLRVLYLARFAQHIIGDVTWGL